MLSLAVQGTHRFFFVKFSGIIGVKLRLYSENKMKKKLHFCYVIVACLVVTLFEMRPFL